MIAILNLAQKYNVSMPKRVVMVTYKIVTYKVVSFDKYV